MKVNTLVTHNKIKNLGIGCVSKILSKKVRVNFGLDDTMTCSKEVLIEVDTSKCKEIPFSEFRSLQLNVEKAPIDVIIGNELKHYVGIGYTTTRVITLDDLKRYPRVV